MGVEITSNKRREGGRKEERKENSGTNMDYRPVNVREMGQGSY